MKDVAALAGVSVSTVSRVISGSIPVDHLTAQRVREAITSLDFRPNLLAAGLRSKSGKLIGLVVPGIYEPFASIIGFLEKATAHHGYSLLVGNSRSRADVEERFVDNLIRRHVDGIIFTPVSHETRVLEQLVDSDIPIVWFDRVWEDQRVLTVQLDNRKAGLIAARYLTGCGHQTIGIVTGPPNVDLCHERLAGFVEGARENGVEIDQELLFEGDFSFDSGVLASQWILASSKPVTAVWAQNDLMAVGLLKGLQSRGVAVPKEISILGMDGIPFTRMVHPELTTIQQPLERMCRELLSRILEYEQLIQQHKWHKKFEPELVIRQSVRDLSGAFSQRNSGFPGVQGQ